MIERAYKIFQEAWGAIKTGIFFDPDRNQRFEYMLKSLVSSKYYPAIRTDIVRHIPPLLSHARALKKPPPFLHILISLKDPHINVAIQEAMVFDWIIDRASEKSTFGLLNVFETFDDKGVPIHNLANAAIKHMSEGMDPEMLQAFAYMLTVKYPEFLLPILKRFAAFKNKAIIKDFVQMTGRKSILALMQFMRPIEVQKLLDAKV